jgi:hypothetical protein
MGPVDGRDRPEGAAPARAVQLHLVLPYKFQPIEHPSVRDYLERGYRIDALQRVSDREVLVILSPAPSTASRGEWNR